MLSKSIKSKLAIIVYKRLFLDFLFRPFFRVRPLPRAAANDPKQLASWLDNFGIELEVTGDEDSLSSDKKTAGFFEHTLVVANHRCWFDPLFVMAGLNLSSPKLVAVLANLVAFPYWKNLIIPVSNTTLLKSGLNLGLIKAGLGVLMEDFSVPEIKSLNRSVPKKVTSALKDNSVIIFPDGGVKKDGWYSGVGHALLELSEKPWVNKIKIQIVTVSSPSEVRLIWQGWRAILLGKSVGPLRINLKLGPQLKVSEVLKEFLVTKGQVSEGQDTESKVMQAKQITNYLYQLHQRQ